MLRNKSICTLIIMVLLAAMIFPVIGFGNDIISEPRLALAAPVTDYEINVPSNSAAYVDQGAPDTNTGGMDGSYLRVGKSTEFCYYYHSLIRFHPIAEKDGGLLPDEANITGAGIKLFKENTVTGTVNIYKLAGSFNENAVTWNTKPGLVSKGSYPLLVGSMTLPTSAGWYTINIPVSTVEGWISSPSTNYGIAILPSWTNCKHIAFRSDETSSKPSLVITYTGGEAPPEPPPAPPEDDVPCELTYTVTPPDPAPGELVTITARATDNQALSYVSIQRGYTVLARQDAVGEDETLLEVSYTEVAELPGMNYAIVADDLAAPLPVRYDIIVPVSGTGTEPLVNIVAEWEIDEVIPARYRLIEGDNQTVTLTAIASDPDGLDNMTIFINGAPHDFALSGETSVSRTLTFINNERSRTRFYFSASARDLEGFTSTDPGESYDIARLSDIEFIWNAALGVHNFSTSRLSWTRMVQVFGADECWIVEEWDWKNPWALIYYHAGFKSIADGGHCFGFSTLCNEIYNGRILASDLEYPLQAHQLDRNNTYTKEYLEARQAAQLGIQIMTSKIDQWVTWAAEVGLHRRLLGYIQRDLESDEPGIIGIREGDSGHAIVPWMTRHMGDGTTRVYVYDCNYASDNGTDGIHNAGADITNFGYFPFMEFRFNDWDYAVSWNTTLNMPIETWDDKLFYYAYEDALGDRTHQNRLGDDADAPYVTDQDIPGVIDYLIGVFGGEADIYFEDDEGRVTGIREGRLEEGIPGSIAIVPMLGSGFTDHELYALPFDRQMTIHIEGNSDGEYNLGLLGNASVYSIEEKAISLGVEDTIIVMPSEGAVGHKLRMKTGLADDDYTMRLAHKFAGRTETLDKDFILREYSLEDILARPGSDLEVYTEEGGDAVIVENHGDDVKLDVTLRSTQSVDIVDDIDGIDYIPGSTLEGFLIETGETVIVAPEDWTTTEEAGELHVLGKSQDGEANELSPVEKPEEKESIIKPDSPDDAESDDSTGGSGLVGEEGSPGEDGWTNVFSTTMVIIIVAAVVVVVAALVSVIILSRNRQR